MNEPEGQGSEAPAAALRALASVAELHAQSKPFDSSELHRELNDALWRSGPDRPDENILRELRSRTQQWALKEMATWHLHTPLAVYRMQVFLTTLYLSSQDTPAAVAVVPADVASPNFVDGMAGLVGASSVAELHPYHLRGENQWRQEMLLAARSGDFSKIGGPLRHLESQLSSDAQMAVLLLERFAPRRLASIIEKKQDIFFSIAIRDALAERALEFALVADNVPFKFCCASSVADARLAGAAERSVEVLCAILLQVAETQWWKAWLSDFARHPHADTVGEKALTSALQQLAPTSWAGFVDGVQLWTHAPSAQPVANILVPFLNELGTEKSAEMWRLAFVRWNSWNYGSSEPNSHLFAPAACSFDFPVAMHYALAPIAEVQVEETRLRTAIKSIEQTWFPDLTELVTSRNRLLSRLRLVQHGLVIRNGPAGSVRLLPPAIEPDSDFAAVRYHYFDVSSRTPRRR